MPEALHVPELGMEKINSDDILSSWTLSIPDC